MNTQTEFVTVDASTIDHYGFFCYKSKPKTSIYNGRLLTYHYASKNESSQRIGETA